MELRSPTFTRPLGRIISLAKEDAKADLLASRLSIRLGMRRKIRLYRAFGVGGSAIGPEREMAIAQGVSQAQKSWALQYE